MVAVEAFVDLVFLRVDLGVRAGNGTGAGYDATYYGSGGGAGGGNGTNPNGGTGFQGLVIVEY